MLKEPKRVRTGVDYDDTKLGVEIMAVSEIERYRQLNGENVLKVILKSTKLYPEGFFYCDSCDEELVRRYSWYLHTQRQPYIVSNFGSSCNYNRQYLLFHQEMAYNILGYHPDYINHINGIQFDNVNMNLDVVTSQQNNWCKPSKGYHKDKRCRSFQPHIWVNSQNIWDRCVRTEVEACQIAYQLEMQYEDYKYDFLKDKRKDLDLLDMERTGKISEEEAIYRHVLRHAAGNAWYLYRYNLFDYFNEYRIPIPAYSLNDNGYMVHPITGQRLCPL